MRHLFDIQNRIKVILKESHAQVMASLLILFYLFWVIGFKLLALTLITRFLVSSEARFQDIGEFFSNNESIIVGLGALTFLFLLRYSSPITSTSTEEIINPHRIERRFLPGYLRGTLIAAGVVLAFIASGFYSYVGLYLQLEEAPLEIANTLFRILALGGMAYAEEFLFRQKLMGSFLRVMGIIPASIATTLAYITIKYFQFDLGWLDLLTLTLLSLILCYRMYIDGDFGFGGGFVAGLLILIHPVLSMPLFGNEFNGVLLVRYNPPQEYFNWWIRILTGGIGGPLSSFAVQIVFLANLIYLIRRSARTRVPQNKELTNAVT